MTDPTTLPGRVVAASSYLAGFDQDAKLTAATAEARFAAGYRFCLRYLTVGSSEESARDLTADEAAEILTAGLALMPVQHVDAYGWSPTEALGRAHGEQAATEAGHVGFPPGVCVWLDLEGVGEGDSSGEVVTYCQAWFAAVAAAGYVPGIYVGPISRLSDRALSDLPFEHYWRAASEYIPTSTRGFQMFQGMVVDGDHDPDYVVADSRGGQALWLTLAPASYPTLQAGNTSPSEAVRCLQRALRAAQAGTPAVDGLFGPGTLQALKKFQASAGLPVTGVVDASTWAALVVAAG